MVFDIAAAGYGRLCALQQGFAATGVRHACRSGLAAHLITSCIQQQHVLLVLQVSGTLQHGNLQTTSEPEVL